MYTCTVYSTCDLVLNSTSESCDKYLMLLNIFICRFLYKTIRYIYFAEVSMIQIGAFIKNKKKKLFWFLNDSAFNLIKFMKRLAIKKLSAMSTFCHKSVADDVFMTYAEDITRWFHDKSSINLSVSSALCSVLENSDGRWFSFLHYFLFFMDNGSIEFSCVII